MNTDSQVKSQGNSSSQKSHGKEQQNEKKQDTGRIPQGKSPDFSFDFGIGTQDDEFMRKPRSQAYLDIICSIDLLSATDEEIIERLQEVVDEDTLEEFSEMSAEELLEELRLVFQEEMAQKQAKLKELPEPEILLGVVSKCYIDGCDIHLIDGLGNILQHFSTGKHLSEEYGRARKLFAKHKNCQCIEVYNNCCRVIANDGSVTKFMNEEI